MVVDALTIYELLKQFDLQLEILRVQEIRRNDNKVAYELGGMACARGVAETLFSDFRPVTNMLVAKDTTITQRLGQ